MATATYPVGGVSGQAKRPALAEYFTWSLDHKIIGMQYIATSIFFFIIAGAMAMIIRLELMTPELNVVASGSQFNTLFSLHGTMMIFTWIVPFWAGLGNYVIPLMLASLWVPPRQAGQAILPSQPSIALMVKPCGQFRSTC
jgi:heme/copper-type cytochrome/quinol oxidase subunit 1